MSINDWSKIAQAYKKVTKYQNIVMDTAGLGDEPKGTTGLGDGEEKC